MEIKVSVLREFLEEELEESINVLGSSIRVGGTAATMRITDIQGLIFLLLVYRV